MKSVTQRLGTNDFVRVRVGIGKPENKQDLINYVIGHIAEEDKNILDKGTTIAKDAVIDILKYGIDNAMNKIN